MIIAILLLLVNLSHEDFLVPDKATRRYEIFTDKSTGTEYLLNTTLVTWYQARAFCKSHFKDTLAEPESRHEIAFHTEMLSESDLGADEWWVQSQISRKRKNEECTAVYKVNDAKLKFVNLNCKVRRAFICANTALRRGEHAQDDSYIENTTHADDKTHDNTTRFNITHNHKENHAEKKDELEETQCL